MVAEHMAHREETQSQYYKTSQSMEQALQSSAHISSLLASSPVKSSRPSVSREPYLPEPKASLLSADQEGDSSSTADESEEDSSSIIPPSDVLDEEEAISHSSSGPSKSSSKLNKKESKGGLFTFQEEQQIREICKDNLSRASFQKMPMKTVVRILRKENSMMMKWTVQQLYDKIRKLGM